MNPLTAASPIGAPATSCRILVVDADHRVRDSLAGLISLADDLDVVGATSGDRDTLDALGRLHPDVVVIDPCLPDPQAGLALMVALRSADPGLRIVATYRLDDPEAGPIAAVADVCVDMCTDSRDFHDAVIIAVRRVAPARPAAEPTR